MTTGNFFTIRRISSQDVHSQIEKYFQSKKMEYIFIPQYTWKIIDHFIQLFDRQENSQHVNCFHRQTFRNNRISIWGILTKNWIIDEERLREFLFA